MSRRSIRRKRRRRIKSTLQCGLVTRRDLIERSAYDYDATLRQWKREQQDFGKFETIGEMFGSPVEEKNRLANRPYRPAMDAVNPADRNRSRNPRRWKEPSLSKRFFTNVER